ncbi:hypothetical protein [Halopseudomonas sabulinigri]|uniref:hypothetical protein n=1 Tax=Halopseudomonas sabulinigri TaxID=472181 RepID=UPI001E43CCB7|nr:hypothetical protein [Halopseudomonas sabulinigri]
MQFLIGLIGLLLLIVTSLRRWLLRRESPQKQAIDFSGELYQVGSAVIARSRTDAPAGTVIVMHGFVENFLYFTEYYSDPELQLIMLTSADYHLPVNQPRFTAAEWSTPPAVAPVPSPMMPAYSIRRWNTWPPALVCACTATRAAAQ